MSLPSREIRERRVSVRRPDVLRAVVRPWAPAPSGHRPPVFPVAGRDLSEGGVGLVSRHRLPVGCRLDLVIELPEGGAILRTHGRVTHVTVDVLAERWRLGIAFAAHGLDPEDRALLRNHLARG